MHGGFHGGIPVGGINTFSGMSVPKAQMKMRENNVKQMLLLESKIKNIFKRIMGII